MVFKSSDYALSYDTFFPFDLYHSTDTPISFIRKIKHSLVYASNNYVTVRNDENEKQVRFDSEVTALDTKSKLIAAGDYNGTIKLFNNRKLQLGVFEENRSKINDIVFISKHEFASGSNDRTVRLFDIMHKESISIYEDHKDFVNCLFSHENLLFSGGCDGKIVVHDKRCKEKINELNFGHRINKMCVYDNDRLLVSEKYKIHSVDLRNNKNTESCYAHMKEVSSLNVYNDMIYTTGHDGILKTYNKQLKIHSQIKFNDKILSCHIYRNDIFIGLENGNILNFVKEEKKIDEKNKEIIEPKPVRYYTDEKDRDIKRIKHDKMVKNEYEKLIDNNHHWIAFSKVLHEKDADLVFGVLLHIFNQKGFGKVLIDRTEEDLKILMDFVIDNFFVRDYRMIIHKIISLIFNMYDEYFINGIELRERVMFLSELVDEEKVFQEQAIILYSFGEALLINRD